MESRDSSRKRREPAHPVVRTQHASLKLTTRPLRIMLVKNIPAVDGDLGDLLEQAGYRLRTVHNCEEVIREARHFRPHIIFADISLPDIGTYALAGKLRDEGLEDLVLVAVSRYGGAAYESRILRTGFDYHLAKPVDPQELLPLMQSVASELR